MEETHESREFYLTGLLCSNRNPHLDHGVSKRKRSGRKSPIRGGRTLVPYFRKTKNLSLVLQQKTAQRANVVCRQWGGREGGKVEEKMAASSSIKGKNAHVASHE